MRFVTRQQRLRHNLITDWRGLEDGPLLDSPAVGMDSLIPAILKSWKLDERLHEEELSAAWLEMVGDFIAKHTAPDGLKRGVLMVRVLQPAVHHTLMMEKGRLLKRMQERFGKDTVKEVRFRHG
ncbi:MAG: hypothetical protein RL693_202 [Verrucomicrobiota bacterium]|jgi:hypothetical protein